MAKKCPIFKLVNFDIRSWETGLATYHSLCLTEKMEIAKKFKDYLNRQGELARHPLQPHPGKGDKKR